MPLFPKLRFARSSPLLTCASTLVLNMLSTPSPSPPTDHSSSFDTFDYDLPCDLPVMDSDDLLLLPPWGYRPPVSPPPPIARQPVVPSPATPARIRTERDKETTWTPPLRKQHFQCYAPTCEAPNCPAHGKSSPSYDLFPTPSSTNLTTPSSTTSSSTSLDTPSSSSSSSLPAYDPQQQKAIVLPSYMLPGLAPIARPSEDSTSFVRPLSPEPVVPHAVQPFGGFEPLLPPLELHPQPINVPPLRKGRRAAIRLEGSSGGMGRGRGMREAGLPFTVDCAVRGMCLVREGKVLDVLPVKK